MTDAKHLQRIAGPMYFAAAILTLFPTLELVQATSPFRPSDAVWRVGAIGLFSRAMATPMLALLIACGAALILEQPRVLRTLATITAGFGVLMMVGLMVYVLDALQVRTQITAQARATFQLGFLLSLLKFGVGLAFVESFAVVAWRAATALKRSAVHHAHSRSAPPVLRRSGQAPAEPEPSPVLAGSTASDEFNSAGELIRGQPA